jgi:hypothetical protein
LRFATGLDLAAQDFDWTFHDVECQRCEQRAGKNGDKAEAGTA